MLEIPDELLINILSYLDLKDIIACSLLDKKFNLLIQKPVFWKTTYQKHFPKLFTKKCHISNLNWHEELIQANAEPSSRLLLDYLSYYEKDKRQRESTDRLFIRKTMQLLAIDPSEEVYKKVVNKINVKDQDNISWADLIFFIRSEAEQLINDSYNNKSLLANFLHGLANLIIASLKNNVKWNKYLALLRKDIKKAYCQIYIKDNESSNGDGYFYSINSDESKKYNDLMHQLVLLGDTNLYHEAIERKVITHCIALSNPNYHESIYNEYCKPISLLHFNEYFNEFIPRAKPVRLRMLVDKHEEKLVLKL